MIQLRTDHRDLFKILDYSFDLEFLNSSEITNRLTTNTLKDLIQIDPSSLIGQFWTGLKEINSKPNNPTTVFLGGMLLMGTGTLLVLKTNYPPLQLIGGAACLLGTVMFFFPKVMSETIADLQHYFTEPSTNIHSS